MHNYFFGDWQNKYIQFLALEQYSHSFYMFRWLIWNNIIFSNMTHLLI